jgi:hypothetical protein
MSYEEVIQSREYFATEYLKAKEAYPSLPTLDEIDAEWDILEAVSRSKLFPRAVVRYTRYHMMEGVNSWAGYLHNFILPNPQNAAAMEEYNYLSEKEKHEIIDTLNWIMYRNREMNLLQLNEDDERTVVFIVETFKEWQQHKKHIKSILEKNTSAWKAKLKK